MEYPDSVEEAAALLGATITRCCGGGGGVNGRNIHEAILPPLGMHPAFAVVMNPSGSDGGIGTPESELLHRLYILRSMLRTAADANAPLVAAPSILQVLKKLLGISTQVAAAAAAVVSATSVSTPLTFSSSSTNNNSNNSSTISSSNSATLDTTSAVGTTGDTSKDATPPPPKQRKIVLVHKYDTPPLWSTPCRKLWVDCVVLCHALSSSTNHNDLTLFVRQMLDVASIHPRSVKAGGGVRIAALAVIGALLEHDDDVVVAPERGVTIQRPLLTLATKLAPWSLDILQVCLKALRSAGNGEPTFREAAIRAAGATAVACRNVARNSRHTRRDDGSHSITEDFCLPGAMEDRAMAESIKILKQAATDKFPEVRSGAATLAITLAPILISHHGGASSGSTADPLSSLEEVIQLAQRNLDDESLVVADGWAEALARCLCTAIQHNETVKASTQSTARSTGGGEGGGDRAESSGASVTAPSPTAATSRFGAKKYSGLAHTLTTQLKVIQYLVEQFVKVGGESVATKSGGLYSTGGRAIRLGWCMTLARFLRIQSAMSAIGESRSISVPTVICAVLDMVKEQDRTTKGTPAARPTLASDIALCRLFALRVIRYGLTELASESTQLNILQELVALLPSNENSPESTPKSQYRLQGNQVIVVLVEVSNLIVALGEAAGSRIDELKSALHLCLVSSNSEIRYEASVLCVAIASKLPLFGITIIHDSLEVIQQQLALIVEAIPTGQGTAKERNDQNSTIFGKATKLTASDSNASNESAILGRSLVISMLTKAMPNHPDGFPRFALSEVLKVAEMLISSQFNELLTTSSPSNVCSLVRAGFAILCGVLTTGPDAAEAHMSEIISSWKKAGNAARNGGKKMSLVQDLSCVESALTSVTVFLKHCSELLLVIPEALSQVSMLLEEIFPLLQENGRLGNISNDANATIMLENATATLLEAFAWLPSGSFPLVADEVFTFAEEQIRKSVEEGIVCSILDSLIAKQDNMLDSKSFCRSKKGTKFGIRDFDDASSIIHDEIALYSECESVFHLQSNTTIQKLSESDAPFCGSVILEYFANDDDTNNKPPTPLHEVGTWRKPVDPSCSSRIRLVDAAIQAFSATFGLKDGKEQQGAMNLLETLLPQPLCNFARTIGISAVPTEPEKRSKVKDDSAAAINITAVLLSCLQALPLHEATHNIPIGLGPPWMNKAKIILLTLLPSPSTNVRRASAEGLALLATLGVTEDAHFLQSALLHSLDEIMQSNKQDGKARTLALDHVSAARAGSLLTLACIQRTANNVAKRKRARARGRLYGNNLDQNVDKSSDDLPVLQMMTRILPSAACHGFKEHIIVKTHALNAFTVLLMYSTRLDAAVIGEDDKQLLRKGIELVEDNFSGSWTASSNDIDKGQEADRMDCEIAFVAVLLRLMTFLLPYLRYVRDENNDTARRFSVFATLALENIGLHPCIFVEAMAFFEVSCSCRNLFPKHSQKLRYTENAVVSSLPSVFEAISPARPDVFGRDISKSGQLTSFGKSMKAAVFLLRFLPLRNESGEQWTPMMVSSVLVAALEVVCGSRRNERVVHTVATNRQMKHSMSDDTSLECEMFSVIMSLLLSSGPTGSDQEKKHLLRCILLARQLLTRFTLHDGVSRNKSAVRETVVANAISQAVTDSSYLYNVTNSARWQVKFFCTQLATEALQQLSAAEMNSLNDDSKPSEFDLLTASNIFARHGEGINLENDDLSSSRLVFHLEDVLSSACMSSVATVDQAELRSVQVNSVCFVRSLVECFGQIQDPEEPSKCILYQYFSQILSSVKSALAARGKEQSKQLSSLFVVGCELLQSIVKHRLTTEVGVVKRLLSMIFPPEDSLPQFSYNDGFRSEFSCTDAALVVRVVGTLTVGNILLGRRMNLDVEFVETIARDIINDRLGVATYLAAAAVDGCRILLSQKISLVGIPLDDAATSENFRNCGFFYQNIDDLDDLTKSVLTSAWTQCACSSLEVLIEQVNSEALDETCRDLCSTWINALVPLLLCGVYSGINSLLKDPQQTSKLGRQMNIDRTKVLNDSMYCIGCILSSKRSLSLESFYDDIDAAINLAYDTIISSSLSDVVVSHPFEESTIKEACNLINMYAQSNIFSPERNPTFLRFLLTGVTNAVGNTLIAQNNQTDEVIATCFLALSEMMLQKQITTNSTVVKSMMHHSLKTLMSQSFIGRDKLRDAATVLLKSCLLDPSTSSFDNVEKVLCQLASNDLWEEWAMIIGLDAEVYPNTLSVQILQQQWRNPSQHKSHAAALDGVRLLLQHSITTSPNLIGQLFYDVGADIVNLLYTYGAMKIQPVDVDDMMLYRTAICADSMKIILLVYRHLSTESNEESHMTTFLSVIFEVFLSVIRFNGLPNHPSPEPRYNDPGLGRICAQAILFVARTTPIPFKECVAMLPNDHQERTLLEYAVRAEMNGYVVTAPTTEPIKKKLNLKSFQK